MTSSHLIDASADPSAPTPAQLGLGLRFSLHPHTDDFADVILGSLGEVADAGLTAGLRLRTDEVSTHVAVVEPPAHRRLTAYLTGVIGTAHRRSGDGHVVAHVLFSQGCPGEVTCDLSATGLPEPVTLEAPAAGISAIAHWSIYPLIDAGSGEGAHMDHIWSAIDGARAHGVEVTSVHYATRLAGDLADVLATVIEAWSAVGSEVRHVVSHVTVSVGSPSPAPAAGEATS